MEASFAGAAVGKYAKQHFNAGAKIESTGNDSRPQKKHLA
jgi:hypothetical protein